MMAHHGGIASPIPVVQEKSRRFWIQQAPWSDMVSSMDRGEPIITNLFIFLCSAAKDAQFWCLKGVFDG